MISKFSHRVIQLYFAWTNFIHIYPYTYNKQECCVELSPKIRKWFIVSAIVICHEAFTMARIFQDFFLRNGSTEDFLFRFFFVAAYGLALTNQLNSLVYCRELAALMTMYLRMDRVYAEKYEKHDSTVDILGFLVGLVFPCIVMSQETLYIGIYFFNPKSPNFINSFLDTEPYSKVSLLMILPEMVMFIYAWSSVYWSLLVVFTFQMSTNHWLKEISLGDLKVKSTRRSLSQPEVAMKIFRQLQILTRIFNNTMATIYQPLHALFMSGIFVTCAFTTVHCYGRMHWFAYLLNPVTAIAVVIYFCVSYPTAAGILVHSEGFLHSWKKFFSLFRQRELQKALQSYPSLKIHMGRQYHVERNTLFTCLNIMVNQTIALLVGVR